MTTTLNKTPVIARYLLVTAITMLTFISCKKNVEFDGHPRQAFGYSPDVLDKWMSMQIRLMRNATGIPNQAFSRHFAYSGITAIESLAPGLPAHSSWTRKWNGLTGLPEFSHKTRYYFPANVNAAMATINRLMFPNASAPDKSSIDSLENALTQEFLLTEKQTIIDASAQFGKAVAGAIFAWSQTDNSNNASLPYTPPPGPGLWIPTPPAFAAALTPYWGNNRTVVKNSIINTQAPPPISYSAQPNSPFYNMVKEVYDASFTLTDEQKAMALFWRDVPGVTSPGHWLCILQQVVRQTKSSLDKAAIGYALTGAVINDGLITCLKTKYQYNLIRPVSYVRDVFGNTTWLPFLTTPAHPEYPSAHSSASAGAAEMLEQLFGNIGSFTDHTYDYLGFAPRTFPSFTAIAVEAGNSRLYAGIHYKPSIDAGLVLGKKVTTNIFAKGNK